MQLGRTAWRLLLQLRMKKNQHKLQVISEIICFFAVLNITPPDEAIFLATCNAGPIGKEREREKNARITTLYCQMVRFPNRNLREHHGSAQKGHLVYGSCSESCTRLAMQGIALMQIVQIATEHFSL